MLEPASKQAEYRGSIIEAMSYQNSAGKWYPKAEINFSNSRGGQRHTVESTREYPTQAEANAHALLLAELWIDKHR